MNKPNFVLTDLDSAIKAISIIADVTNMTEEQWNKSVELHEASKNTDITHITDRCTGANTVKKYIELVEKWLADNDSVSQLQLEANAADAYAAHAENAAENAAYYAAYAAAAADGDAARWVAKYHSLVKKQTL